MNQIDNQKWHDTTPDIYVQGLLNIDENQRRTRTRNERSGLSVRVEIFCREDMREMEERVCKKGRKGKGGVTEKSLEIDWLIEPRFRVSP